MVCAIYVIVVLFEEDDGGRSYKKKRIYLNSLPHSRFVHAEPLTMFNLTQGDYTKEEEELSQDPKYSVNARLL
jgi:hypothetical protein